MIYEYLGYDSNLHKGFEFKNDKKISIGTKLFFRDKRKKFSLLYSKKVRGVCLYGRSHNKEGYYVFLN